MHSKYSEYSFSTMPWTERSHASYLEDLRKHIHMVTIDSLDDKSRLLDSLHWLVKYPWGRTVKRGHGCFGLRPGDSLCCGGDIGVDKHSLEHLAVPFTVAFFRARASSAICGVSVMWNVPGVHQLGIEHLKSCTSWTVHYTPSAWVLHSGTAAIP